jgi:uncharacterized protein (DUF2252 family)
MSTVGSIHAYNRGRNPVLLSLKWAKMRESAFAFYRGTAPLFYRTWAKDCPKGAPLAWISGDAHLENLGSYKGANRVPYFDINDFDECCLAPVDWEIGRALTALHVLGKPGLAALFLTNYALTLAGGKPGHIEPEVAEGPIAKLLSRVANRDRKDFLKKWISGKKIRIRKEHSFAISRATKAEARRRFEAWSRRQPDPGFYEVLDICGRIAGNGSLGLQRYIVLVSGKHQPYLLDMKAAARSAPRAHIHVRQPPWGCEAERVATVQHFLQYVPIARLSWIGGGRVSYIVHELQPAEDRIVVDNLSVSDHEEFIRQWAHLLASSQLRSAGWKGSADLDTLIAYGQSLNAVNRRRLLAASSSASSVQLGAWAEFKVSGRRKASDRG